mgnify:FL=1
MIGWGWIDLGNHRRVLQFVFGGSSAFFLFREFFFWRGWRDIIVSFIIGGILGILGILGIFGILGILGILGGILGILGTADDVFIVFWGRDLEIGKGGWSG